MKKLISALKYVLIAGMVGVLIIVAIPAASVYASTAVPSTPVPQTAAANTAIQNQLQRIFGRLGNQLSQQATRLQNTSKVIDRAQKRIDTLKQNGKDITALESALTAFKQGIATAQSEHDQAASIHSTAAGFDASGKVTDINQAITTAHTTQDHLVAARRALEDAARQMVWAVMQASLSLSSATSTH